MLATIDADRKVTVLDRDAGHGHMLYPNRSIAGRRICITGSSWFR